MNPQEPRERERDAHHKKPGNSTGRDPNRRSRNRQAWTQDASTDKSTPAQADTEQAEESATGTRTRRGEGAVANRRETEQTPTPNAGERKAAGSRPECHLDENAR
eukprot:gene14349-biopygen608